MMDEAFWSEGVRWLRRGRLRLRGLTRADLALLSGDGVRAPLREAQTHEPWPRQALVQALICRYPELQIAVELDQRVVGGLLACPRAAAPAAVTHPWSQREASHDFWGAFRELPGDTPADASAGILQGVGAVWPGRVGGAQVQKALQMGRQLLVQQRGCEATVSVVRAAGWARQAAGMSAPAYLQQVHARAIEDARLSVYLDAGYMMRGYWQVGQGIEVLMRWVYRAH